MIKKKVNMEQFNLDMLKDEHMRQQYAVEANNIFEELDKDVLNISHSFQFIHGKYFQTYYQHEARVSTWEVKITTILDMLMPLRYSRE